MPSIHEPRNPFNLLLMLASIAFVVTALAFAVVPVLEEKAKAMGETPPPSPFRDSLREHGGTLLLYEVAAMIVFGLASMALDRYRRLNTAPPSPPFSRGGENDVSPPLEGGAGGGIHPATEPAPMQEARTPPAPPS